MEKSQMHYGWFFDKYVEIYFTWGRDFFQEFLRPFHYFISKATDKFISRGSIEKIWNIFKFSLENEDSEDIESMAGCVLIEQVFVYCRGNVDVLVGPVIDIVLKKLSGAEMNFMKVALLEVIANTLYYNPLIALNHLESKGFTEQLFQTWFTLLNASFKRKKSIKSTILGLSALLYLPFPTWPKALQPQMKNIINSLMELCKKYMKIKEAESSSVETDSSDSESDLSENEDVKGVSGDEDMPIDEEKSKNKKNKVYADEEDIESDFINGSIFTTLADLYADGDDESIEDDYEFSTKIDEIDEIVFFLEAFQSISKRDSSIYQQLLSSFSQEEQNKLHEIANEANRRQQEKATQSNKST